MRIDVQDESLPIGWRPPEFPGLEILRGAFRHHEFPRHYHNGLMISVIDSGAQEIHYKGTSYVASKDQIVAIPAGEVHAGRDRGPDGWRYCVFTVPYSMVDVPFPGLHQGFASPVIIDDGDLAGRLRVAHAAFSSPSTTLQREELLSLALELYFARYADPAPPRISVIANERALARAIDYLAEHYDRNVGLAELASAAELDGFHLTRAFTSAKGMPPHAYHIQARLRKAQERLAAGAGVTDVAHDLGFSDQAHLTRLFKRLTGVTPGRYRAAHHHLRFRE